MAAAVEAMAALPRPIAVGRHTADPASMAPPVTTTPTGEPLTHASSVQLHAGALPLREGERPQEYPHILIAVLCVLYLGGAPSIGVNGRILMPYGVITVWVRLRL